jgi:hypothetical protein
MTRLLVLFLVALWCLLLLSRGAEANLCEVTLCRIRVGRAAPFGYGRVLVEGKTERKVLVWAGRRLEWRT